MYSESATAIVRPQRNSAYAAADCQKGPRTNIPKCGSRTSVIFMYDGMQLQWRAHLFPSETDQKCVALDHWTAKAALSGPHVN